ncbi:MAG: MFS transporter [Candidatus Dormibacteria bacterium]
MRAERPEVAAAAGGRGRVGMYAAFEVRAFRWVWMAVLSGNSGRFAVILVAGWEAYRLGHESSLWPSLVSMLLLVPSMVFGLFAGGIADRRNRAQMAAAGQLINAGGCGVGAVLVLAGDLNLPVLLLLTAVVGIGNSVQGPAWQAMIPGLVGEERLLNASMATRIAQQGAELTGPAVATVVLAGAGAGAAFMACAGFYVIGLSLLWRLRRAVATPAHQEPHAGMLTPIRQGLTYVRREQPLGTLLLWVGLHCSLTMASIGILPAVAMANLRGNVSAYGLLLTAFGFGSVLGPLLLMWLGSRVAPVPTLVVSGVLSGLPLITLGLVHVMVVAVISAAVAGGAQGVFMAGIYSANQGRTADAMRGRVASVQLSLTTGAMGVASVGWGALVALVAPGIVLAVPGAVFVVACIPFALRSRRISSALLARDAGMAWGNGSPRFGNRVPLGASPAYGAISEAAVIGSDEAS